jgi:hypothetical protein
MADIDSDDPLMSLQAASCTYRIALWPCAGQAVVSLRTVAAGTRKPRLPCAVAHGFSLHAGVHCGPHWGK